MSSLFKRKRHDPEAIAEAVLRVGSNPGNIAGFLEEFASSEREFPRAILGAVIYADCWAMVWAIKQKDSRVSDACTRADEIIASRVKGAANLMRVSDYVVSELELAEFSLEFFDYFRQHVPLEIGVYPDIKEEVKAHREAIRSHQMRFETLVRMILAIRNKRMTREISRSATSNMDQQNTIAILADMLYEQITGVTPLDLGLDVALWHEWDLSRPRRMEAVLSLTSRLELELGVL
jgi:hypothetical protein